MYAGGSVSLAISLVHDFRYMKTSVLVNGDTVFQIFVYKFVTSKKVDHLIAVKVVGSDSWLTICFACQKFQVDS